jgi:hypothetical protein
MRVITVTGGDITLRLSGTILTFNRQRPAGRDSTIIPAVEVSDAVHTQHSPADCTHAAASRERHRTETNRATVDWNVFPSQLCRSLEFGGSAR